MCNLHDLCAIPEYLDNLLLRAGFRKSDGRNLKEATTPRVQQTCCSAALVDEFYQFSIHLCNNPVSAKCQSAINAPTVGTCLYRKAVRWIKSKSGRRNSCAIHLRRTGIPDLAQVGVYHGLDVSGNEASVPLIEPSHVSLKTAKGETPCDASLPNLEMVHPDSQSTERDLLVGGHGDHKPHTPS